MVYWHFERMFLRSVEKMTRDVHNDYFERMFLHSVKNMTRHLHTDKKYFDSTLMDCKSIKDDFGK